MVSSSERQAPSFFITISEIELSSCSHQFFKSLAVSTGKGKVIACFPAPSSSPSF
jgi:hypothetical protein